MSDIKVSYFNGSDEVLAVEYPPACADYKKFLIFKNELYYIIANGMPRVVMRDEDQVDFREKEVDFQYLGDQLIKNFPEFFNGKLIRMYSSDEDYTGRMFYMNFDQILGYGFYDTDENQVDSFDEAEGAFVVFKGDDIYYNRNMLKLTKQEAELFINIIKDFSL